MDQRGRGDDDVQVVVELGTTSVWVTLVDPDGPRAPVGLMGVGNSGRLIAEVGVDEDGMWSWGAERTADDTQVVLRGFLARVDDPVPLVIGGVGVPAADLVARQLEHVVGVVGREGGRLSLVTVVHPDDLTAAGVRRIAASLSLA